jgi:DNA-directed RNA polymerase sigma subunit (sigma70/sigma32)
VVLARARGETLADVGRRLGVTRERVRQIQAKAMRRLRLLAAQGVVADEEV